MELSLRNKVAIVTGGASGMGTVIVESFIKEGANVLIVDVNIENAEMLAKKLVGHGAKAVAFKGDVTRKPDAEDLASKALEEFGRMDILVKTGVGARRMLYV